MNLTDKYSVLQTRLIDFINELDAEFDSIRQLAKKQIANSTANIAESYKRLQEFSEQAFTTIKKRRDENATTKNNIAQELTNLNTGLGNSEILTSIKNFIFKSGSQFENTYTESINRVFKPEIGELWIESKKIVSQFDESNFEETRRSNEIQIKLAQTVIEDILNNLKKSLLKIAENDIKSLNNSISKIQNETKELLETNSIDGYKISKKEINFLGKYTELVKSSVRIETEFQGSYPKLDFRTMIIEMRSYSIMFILLVSTFGLNRSNNANLVTGIYITSLILVIIGVFATYAKMQDLKIDKKTDELKKAKERMSIEIKRGVLEFISDWKSYILSNYKSIITDISTEIENLIKMQFKLRQEELSREKARINQILTQIEVKDRSYQDYLRKCENLKHQIEGLKPEISKLT